MKIDVTGANRDELPRIIEIYASPDLKTGAEESRWFVNCYFDYHHINVARVDGQIMGTCFWRIEGERHCGLGWIENLWVEDQSRRMGLGERLLRKSIEDMKVFYERGGIRLRKVALTTQVERSGARKLYEKVGFRSVASLGDLYDPREHDLIYVLDLQS